MGRRDVIIIAGDTPTEVLGKDEREKVRLSIDGSAASLNFLREYFRHGRSSSDAASALKESAAPFLSINGPYLCQYLTRAGYHAELIPVFTSGMENLERLLEKDPVAVVISTTFLPFAVQIDAIAGFVKKRAPRTTVIAGGIQVWKSFKHRELLAGGQIGPDIRDAVSEHNYLMDENRASPVDIFIVSESGEGTLLRVLERLGTGIPCDVPNTACFISGKWRVNHVEPETCGEIKVDWAAFLRGPVGVYVPVQAGLGCAFRCAFCDFRDLRMLSVRTPESVIEEIRTIPPLDGTRRVYFTDDNLFPNRARVREVCSALIKARLGVKWRGLLRVSAIDEETAGLMAESGCVEVLLGIESGDADMLRRMRKQMTPEGILRGVETLSRAGISTKSTFIVGFPGETDKSLDNTVALLNAYPTNHSAAHRYLFFTFAVLPLSDVASVEARAMYRLEGYGYHWSHATMNAKEAAAKMEAMHAGLKDELSPSYVLEVPDMPGLGIEDIKRIYLLRGRLARMRNHGSDAGDEARMWSELEQCFRPALASRIAVGG